MKILLAVDGSPCSEAAIVEVARRPWPPHSEVRLLMVEPLVDGNLLQGSPTVFDEIVAQQRDVATKRLDDVLGVFRRGAPEMHVTPLLREGWPKEVIVAEAEQWGADLIIVGSHGYGTFERLLLGSVSLAVATHAPCSVEIVRTRGWKSPEDSPG